MKIQKLCGLICLLLWSAVAVATVPASLDRDNVEIGQSFTLSISLPSSGVNPDLAPLQQDFQLLGTGSSSQVSIVNGQTSSEATFAVSLTPKKAGKLTIPPLKVGTDLTPTLSINVIPSTAVSPNQSATSGDSAQFSGKTNLFATLSATKPSSYVGVPLTLTLKIYVDGAVRNLEMRGPNFSAGEIKELSKPTQYSERKNGKIYQVVEQKLSVRSTQPGKLLIPPFTISGVVPSPSAGDFFALPTGKAVSRSTQALTLEIKAIPAQLDPSLWLPATKLELSDDWSLQHGAQVGQPLVRTITLKAYGVTSSSLPQLSFADPRGANSYPEKPQDQDDYSQGQPIATRVYKITYLPTQSGELVVPAQNISWWDLNRDQVQTKNLAGRRFQILPASGQAPASANSSPESNHSSKPKSSTNLSASSPAIQRNSASAATLPLVPRSRWFYLALGAGGLWLLSLLGLLYWWLRRKYPTKSVRAKLAKYPPRDNYPPSSTPNSLLDSSALSEITSASVALTLLENACARKDLAVTNQILIKFAQLHWQRKVYTAADILDLAVSSELKELVEEFNLALYKGDQFSHFTELAKVVRGCANLKPNSQPAVKLLEDFYPD